jgi:hypothetical protein
VKRIPMTIWMMAAVLTIGSVSLGVTVLNTETINNDETPTTRPAEEIESTDFFNMIEFLSTNKKINGVLPPEFMKDVVESFLRNKFSTDSLEDMALLEKKEACFELICRIKLQETEDILGDFLERFDAADQELERVIEERNVAEKLALSKLRNFFNWSLASLVLGFIIGSKIMKKRNCPRRIFWDLVIPTLLGLFTMVVLITFIYGQELIIGSGSSFFLAAFLAAPILISMILPNHVMIDAEALMQSLCPYFTIPGNLSSRAIGPAKDMVFALADPRTVTHPINRRPIDSFDILSLVEELQQKETLEDSDLKRLYDLLFVTVYGSEKSMEELRADQVDKIAEIADEFLGKDGSLRTGGEDSSES